MAFGRKKNEQVQSQQAQAPTQSRQLTEEQRAFMEQYDNKKNNKKVLKKSKRKEKIDMYDMILANIIAGNSIIEPTVKLDNSQLAVGFSNISSDEQLQKYFMINKFPDFLQPRLVDIIRAKCMQPGIKINFYFNAVPHRINWDSSEMKNRMNVWRQYSAEHSGPIDIFAYRAQRGEAIAKQRIMTSTKYLNEAELEYKRSFLKVVFIIEISANRTEEGLSNMAEAIKQLKDLCNQSDIKLAELRVNMMDWLRVIGPFSLQSLPQTEGRLAKRVVTDDILANFNSYKQGRVGNWGVSLGIDIMNSGPVMRKFKADGDAADNWLISAATGGGKSFWVKALLTYLLADDFVVCVMDYEGDEYTNLANYIKAGNPEDVKVVSMGKGSTLYFDPCEIPELTGDPKVDDDLKESAVGFILAIFRVIVCGMNGDFTKEQERVMSLAIQRMYDTAGVTDDKKTWYRSKGLRLHDVYHEIKEMVETKELVDTDSDNMKHKAAVNIIDSASVYFEPGESKSGTFKNPMSAESLYHSKLIIFSFGMKGATDSASDPTLLALRQLSVAYINISISNYCKYVRKQFNVKVWEEFQRYGESAEAGTVVMHAITGGRKRGDVNFIITNDLAAMLDDSRKLNKTLRQNIQNYAIGKIPDESVRQEFVDKFDLQDVKPALDNIAKAHTVTKSGTQKASGAQSRYKHAFCVVLEEGKKAIVKVMLPKSLLKSSLFKTGVDVKEDT